MQIFNIYAKIQYYFDICKYSSRKNAIIFHFVPKYNLK